MLSLLTFLAILRLSQAQQITKDQISPKNGPYAEPPMLGFGTWMLNETLPGYPGNCSEAVAQAVVNGYRHFDGATAYQNQECVGKGLKEGMQRAGIKRKDLWVTSKLWSSRYNPLHENMRK